MQSPNKKEVSASLIHENDDEEEVDMELAATSETSETAKKVAVAAVLASLSVAVSPIAAGIPRIPLFGIAIFDPISLFWMIAFLVGGFWVGLFSMATGAFMLNFFDPYPIFGPMLKFLATFPMVILPWLAVRNTENQGQSRLLSIVQRIGRQPDSGNLGGALLSKTRIFSLLMVLSYLVRIAVMTPVNLIVVPFIWGVTDPGFIIIYTVGLNTIQSFWDAFIPFIVVHRTPIFSNYGMW